MLVYAVYAKTKLFFIRTVARSASCKGDDGTGSTDYSPQGPGPKTEFRGLAPEGGFWRGKRKR